MAPIATLDFKCALVTGGGGGLVCRSPVLCSQTDIQGKAIAQSLIKRGKKVIIAGRTEDTLKATATEIGAAAYYVLDTGRISAIPAFIDTILGDHPELDCLINNAGVQRPFQVMGPEYEFDLSQADEEIDINIRGPMHLSVLLVQKHFSKLQDGAVIMNVSSVLGFNPFSVINPVYNGTKAWVHMFTTNLRTQLSQLDDGKGGKIKVVEIVPPQVESDLHRDRTDPDDNKKHKSSSAMSVEEFIKDVEEGWEKDLDTIAPGVATKSVTAWEETMGKVYKEMTSK